MGVVVKRFDIFLVELDPTVGSEIKKTRPCVILSPDEMNRHLATAIIAPMTTQGHAYPSRVPCRFEDKDGYVVIDQLRTVVKPRLVCRLGRLSTPTQKAVLATLSEFFAE